MAKKKRDPDREPTWTPTVHRGSCLKQRRTRTSDNKLFIIVCMKDQGHLGGCD